MSLPEGSALQSATISRFAAAARQDGRGVPEALRQITTLERQLPRFVDGARWSGMPRSTCHGDLHPGNIGHRAGNPTRPVVFDWEAVAINRAGSDLDRLFRIDGTADRHRAFEKAVTTCAAHLPSRLAVDPADMEIAAGVFALQRRMARYLKEGRTGRDRLTDTLLTWRMLEQRLFI